MSMYAFYLAISKGRYLSTFRVLPVSASTSKWLCASESSTLVCTRLRSRASFKVLYRPGGTTGEPNELATMAENLHGEQAKAACRAWKLSLTRKGSVEKQPRLAVLALLNRCVILLLKWKGILTFGLEILNAASLYCPSKTAPLVYMWWYSYYSVELTNFHAVTQFI